MVGHIGEGVWVCVFGIPRFLEGENGGRRERRKGGSVCV